MNRLNQSLGYGLLSLLLALTGCHSTQQSYQVVYVGETGHRYVGTTSFRKARIRWHPYRLQLTAPTGQIETRQPDQLWGLQQADGPRYRLYEGEFYEEIDGHTLLIYRHGMLGNTGPERLYFSSTPTAALVPLTRRNLQQISQTASILLSADDRIYLDVLIGKYHVR
jgi:hypothetical protein